MADILYEGFDHYGIAGEIAFSTGNFLSGGTLLNRYWTSVGQNSVPGQTTINIVAGRFANSLALQFSITGASTGAFTNIFKTLAGSFSTLIFGFALNTTLGTTTGITFGSVSVGVNTSGQIVVYRGDFHTGTLLATSVQSITANTWHHIGGQITFNASTGAAQIYLDGVATSINITGQNTGSSVSSVGFQQNGASVNPFIVDDLFLFDTTGPTNNTFPGDMRVETLFPNSDFQAQFAFVAAILGAAYNGSNVSNAPGANELVLRPFTTGPGCTLNDVRIIPAASSLTANFKAVYYADNGLGTAPTGAPLATGTQVTGCTAGAILPMPFVSGQVLSSNTVFWLGFITDTSIALNLSDNNTFGYKAANTYGSGAPTNPVMTSGQSSWMLWGGVTATGVNWWEVSQNPSVMGLSSLNSSTVGNEDLFGNGGLSSNPQSIAGLKVMALITKSDAGARTISLRIKSGATDSGGSLTGQTPASSYVYLESYFPTDPATGVAWLPSGIGNAFLGYKIDS